MTLPNEAGSRSNCQSPFSAPQPMSLTSPTSRLTAPLTRGSELRFFETLAASLSIVTASVLDRQITPCIPAHAYGETHSLWSGSLPTHRLLSSHKLPLLPIRNLACTSGLSMTVCSSEPDSLRIPDTSASFSHPTVD